MNLRIGLTTAVLCVLLAGGAAAQPKIALSQPNWDFGAIWHMEQPSITLMIRNEGDQPLILATVHASCGCTAVKPKSTNIAPGGSTEVQVTFNSQGKQGRVTSSVTIKSNDPVNPEMKFEIAGEVKRAVVLTPLGGVVIRSLDPTGPHSGKCTIENKEEQPMQLKVLGQDSAEFDVELKEITPGRLYEMHAKTRRALPIGQTKGSVRISTGLSREPEVTVWIGATIIPRVDLVPAAIYLAPDLMDKPTERVVNVQYYGDDPNWSVLEAKSLSPLVTVQVEPTIAAPSALRVMNPAPNRMATVRFRLPAAKDLPAEGVNVELTTTDREYGILTVVVTNNTAVFQKIMHGGQRPPARPLPGATPATQPAAAPTK